MKRTHIMSLMLLLVAVPAAGTASSFIASNAKPCFAGDAAAYQLSDSATADYIVRIDNKIPRPDLRMQIVDDPAAADFVLLDDADQGPACNGTSAIKTIRIDDAATQPDMTVTLSQSADADYRIYVRSANYSTRDAAALFVVMWQTARKIGAKSGVKRQIAARD